MAFNGSGSFTPDGAYFPVVSGSLIESAKFNGTINDLASGLSNCLTKDGQQTVTANLAMSGYRHTGVGDGATRTDYASVGQLQDGGSLWAGTAGGTGNAITLTLAPAISAYAAGQSFTYKSSASANTSTMTVAVSGLATKAIQKDGAAVASGDHPANKWFRITYDGAAFQLEQIAPTAAAITTALALKSNIASPTFTGTVTIPTVAISAGTITGITDIAVADGGTGASTASAARTNLGVAYGPSFSAANAVTQSITSAAPPAKITLGTETHDTAGYFASSRFTPLVPGYYQFSYRVGLIGTVVTSAYAMLYYNGAEVDRGGQIAVPSGAGVTEFHSSGSFFILMNGTTDYVELYASASGTVLVADYSRFSGSLIRQF